MKGFMLYIIASIVEVEKELEQDVFQELDVRNGNDAEEQEAVTNQDDKETHQ